mmetsp:Transcript_3269/g.4502  ORF Transcript_3269/g.4502 Transcript_3269/m.4502 type:complete len:806 (+) Transcript_3269:52-2469(+)
MSKNVQKSISSFFKSKTTPDPTPAEEPALVVADGKKRLKKRRIVDSDEENEAASEISAQLNHDVDEDVEEPKIVSPVKETPAKKVKVESSEEKENNQVSFNTIPPTHNFFAPKTAVNSPVKRSAPVKSEAQEEDNDNAAPKAEPEDEPEFTEEEAKQLKKALTGKFFSTKYDPVKNASWKKGQPVPYLALASTFAEIEKISSRLKIIELLTNLFRSVIALTPQDLLPTIYLTINKIAPEYEGLELGMGESILMKAVAEATGRTLQSLKASYDEMGDLGLVAQASRNTQKTMFAPPTLTIQGVFKKLREIASIQGSSSQNKKRDIVKALLVACRENEAQYIIRSLQGKLRIGLAEKSVLCAVAHAVVLTPSDVNDPSKYSSSELESKMSKANETLRQVYSELPNYDVIIPALLKLGIDGLHAKCHLTPGIPVHPMLAQPTKGISEVLDRFANMTFTCEYKYDGERAQIHCYDGGKIAIYSRNLENNTAKFPDIIQYLPNAVKAGITSFIIDCEAVAFDREKQKILPFQVLSTRARKTVALEDIKVQVCLYAFDLLYLNGESLLQQPLAVRRKKLLESFSEVPGEFLFAQHKDSNDIEEIQAFLNEAVEGHCEGLMIKTLEKEATYEPSKRSYNWLKVKKDYVEGMGDSLDLVVIGAYVGRGKRTGVYGGYLLACYDEDTETYQSICKIGTGFSDEDLQKQHAFFAEHISKGPKPYYSYGENVAADVWFEPVAVWEILAADLSISPVHTAAQGMVDANKGIALRFPRFVRVRDDKKPEDATSATQVADMYRNQKINHAHNGPVEDDM